MKITRVECFPISYPLAAVGGSFPDFPSVFVKVHTDEGIIGMGETGHVAEDYLGTTQESNIGMIHNIYAPKILLGEDPFNIEKIIAAMEVESKFNNQAMCVIDVALHDIMGKALGVPVYKLIGGLTTPAIPMGAVIMGKDPQMVADMAVRSFEAGFTSVKLKVGHLSRTTIEQDLVNIKAVREAVGPDARVGIDSNGGWNYLEALSTLMKMEQYDLFMCEQPLPYWDIDGHARLRTQQRIPIVPDESAHELNHLLQIIEKKAADAVFIKLAKVGGITKARQWVSIAQAANLPVMCGAMGGSGWEGAAQAHFLASNAWMSHLEQESGAGMSFHNASTKPLPRPLVDEDLAEYVPMYKDGYIYVPDGPGLGLELNEPFLQKIISPGKSPTSISE